WHTHRPILTNPPQVVAEQIDDHHVLGPVLGAGEQLGDAGLVLRRSGAARPGALDRASLHRAVFDPEEPFRRGAGEDEIPQVEVAGEWRRVALTQAAVQLQRWQRRGGKKTLCEVHLEEVASRDVLDSTASTGRGSGA